MTGMDFLSGFKKDVYKPDILTCLANLSNDEVFTPPALANEILDLLPQELFKSKETKFLDPVCKSGVFLREIAKRLIIGLEKIIPDEQERRNHIFTKQLFGIAITELTALMSRRSVYCSQTANSKYSVCTAFKDANGNVKFVPIPHTFKNGNCIYCGASEKEYGEQTRNKLESHAYEFIHMTDKQIKEMTEMKFDVIIGNPPYQLSDGGAQASAMPIYNKFVENAIKLQPRYFTMIIPARWYAGGKGLDSFRETMLNDNRIRDLIDFPMASDVFSGVDIKGGVCYFLWDRDKKGDCKVKTKKEGQIISEMTRPLLEKNSDSFVRYNEAISILRKVQNKNEKSFADIVNPAMTFGYRTFFKDYDLKNPAVGYVKMYGNLSVGYMEEDRIIAGKEFIDKWKVFIPEAIGIGVLGKDLLKPILGEPKTVCTETYIMNGPYETKQEAENVVSYINTKFFHFLMGLRKNTQHATQKVYRFIPMQDFTQSWTDEKLYKKYGLTKEEIAFVESMVRPMDANTKDEVTEDGADDE